jgi:hypothetical protein
MRIRTACAIRAFRPGHFPIRQFFASLRAQKVFPVGFFTSRSLLFLAALPSLVLAQSGLAASPDPGGEHVPAVWSGYGVKVGQEVQARLGDDQNKAAVRLHGYLDKLAAKDPNAPPPTPIVRIWIDRTGRISSVQAMSLGDPQADTDLRQVLTASPLGPPPRGMRQPLTLRLRLAYPT